MNVKPISFNNIKCSPIKPQSFNGVWAKPSNETSDIDPAMGIPVVKKFYYYCPFKDETDEQIKQVLAENSSAKIIQDPDDKYLLQEAKRSYKSNFTNADYQRYLTLPPYSKLDEKMTFVHNFVKNKYTTSGFHDEVQKSAANPNIKY